MAVEDGGGGSWKLLSTLEAGVPSRFAYCGNAIAGCDGGCGCCCGGACWLKSGVDAGSSCVAVVVVDATECAGLNGVVPGAGVVCDMEQAVPLPVPEEGDVIGGQAVGVGGGISSWDELSDWLAD